MRLLPLGHGMLAPQKSVRWNFSKLGIKLLVIAFVPFTLTSVCILGALAVLSDVRHEEHIQQRARQIATDAENTINQMLVGGLLVSTYSRTHNPQLIDNIRELLNKSSVNIERIEKNLREDTNGEPGLPLRLHEQSANMMETLNGIVTAMNTPKDKRNVLELMGARRNAIELMLDERKLLEHIQAIANQTSTAPKVHAPWMIALRKSMPVAIGLTLTLSVALAVMLARSVVYRLRTLTDKAVRLAMLQAPGKPETGNDEIAELDRVFTDMATRLLEAIRRQQAAVACAADAIMSVAPSGVIAAANVSVQTICGRTPDAVVGTSVFDLVPPADHEQLRVALKSPSPTQFEAGVLNAQGNSSLCLWSTSWSQGEQSVVTVLHDVTARKQAEELLLASERRTRLLMEQMPAGLVLIGRDSKIRYANETSMRLTNRPQEQLVGTPFTDLLAGQTFGSADAFIETISMRSQAFVSALAGDGKDETRVQWRVSKYGGTAADELFLVIMLDYTERWQFEELKQRLIAMVAHDIASPLSCVQNTLMMAKSGVLGDLPPPMHKEIDAAEVDTAGILQVFKDIVRFQKLAVGFASTSAAQMNLKSLTKEALDVVARDARKKGLQIEQRVPDGVAAIGDVDGFALLAATLLQRVVEACPVDIELIIDGSQQDASVLWRIAVGGAATIPERIRLYLTDVDVFDSDGVTVESDLDLILWRLLLYQCGAQATGTADDTSYTVALRLPSPTPIATAA